VNEYNDRTSEEYDRPWEQPGQERRDSLPHRGHQLNAWARVGSIINLVSILLFPGTLIGIPLCLLIAIVAQMDLAEIRAGTRVRSGEALTCRARNIAIVGFLCGVMVLWLWAMVCLKAPIIALIRGVYSFVR
jgi:hypothetical protein